MTASKFFTSEVIETRFFLLQLLNVMKIMNLTILKLCFAKLTRVSFLMKLHARGLQLY